MQLRNKVMDTTVNGIGLVVVAELRAAGFMESTIGQYEKTIKALASFASESGSGYTVPLGAAFASMTVSPRTGRFSAQRRFDYGRLVTVFDGYVRTGRVDLSIRTRGGGGARPEMSEFIALAVAWEADMSDRGLAPATRDAYGRVARGYLVFLESRGIGHLAEAGGSSVLGFLESLSGRWARSSLFWLVSNFRPFLQFTGRTDLVDAAGQAGVKRSHAILPVLSDDDQGGLSCRHARWAQTATETRRSRCWRSPRVCGRATSSTFASATLIGAGGPPASCSRRPTTR